MATCLHRILHVGARQYVRAVQTHPQLQLGAAFIGGRRLFHSSVVFVRHLLRAAFIRENNLVVKNTASVDVIKFHFSFRCFHDIFHLRDIPQ